MHWYYITSGEWRGPDTATWGTGYSGHGDGINNPTYCSVRDVGPIPPGLYRLGTPFDSPRTGPFTIPLTPDPATDTHGRSDFRVHGDNKQGDRSASHGCIILPHDVRIRIVASGDTYLQVL